MVLPKPNWLRGPTQPGVRRVDSLWGHSERQRGGGGEVGVRTSEEMVELEVMVGS